MIRVSPSALRYGLALSACLALAQCRWSGHSEAPKPLAQRVSWCGQSPVRAFDSLPADTSRPEACIRIHFLEFPGAGAPFRLEMRQYREPRFAFAAWKSLGAAAAGGGAARMGDAAARSGEGYHRIGSRWFFVHKDFLGMTDSSAANLYPEEFKERLAFAGEPAFQLPPEFEAFPLMGRIPGSEALYLRDFLGIQWKGPVYAVAYGCHGDTAVAFRSFPQNPDSLSQAFLAGKGRLNAVPNGFEGTDPFGDPLILKVFKDGVLGISGCFDPVLNREYVEKMEKTRIFWPNP